MSNTKPLEVKDWLDEQEFYEYCQAYRNSANPGSSNEQSVGEAFEALKKYIRDQISVARSIQG